jgi:hypothetical protein
MATQEMSVQKQNFRILVQCPATGEQVLGDKLTHFSLPGAKAAWWYCPKCEGWHALVYLEGKKVNGELNSAKTQLLNLNPVQLT